MADKKPESHGGGGLGFSWIYILMLVVLIFIVVFGWTKPFDPTYLNLEYLFQRILDGVQAIVNFFINNQVGILLKLLITGICILLIGLIFYLFLRLLEMEEHHKEHVYPHDDEDGHTTLENTRSFMIRETSDTADEYVPITEEPPGLYKWQMVIKHVSSKNQSDWKLAIIEADTILDALVEGAGYEGTSLGERLKSADKGTFKTLDYAWEAHTVRNKIAHEGSTYELSEREAKRVIQLYEQVFQEFKYI